MSIYQFIHKYWRVHCINDWTNHPIQCFRFEVPWGRKDSTLNRAWARFRKDCLSEMCKSYIDINDHSLFTLHNTVVSPVLVTCLVCKLLLLFCFIKPDMIIILDVLNYILFLFFLIMSPHFAGWINHLSLALMTCHYLSYTRCSKCHKLSQLSRGLVLHGKGFPLYPREQRPLQQFYALF